nr:SPOR domain-containing protein [Gammaproteobacteria bacterium]
MMRRFLFSTVLVFLSCPALAREVELPLTFDFPFLRQALLAQLYTDPNTTVRIWHDGAGCSDLVLSDPQVDGRAGRLRLLSVARARLGTAVGDRCTAWLDWQGRLEVLSEPEVYAPQREVAFRVVESSLYAVDGSNDSAVTTLWDRIKHQVYPRLARLRIDLKTPLQALEETLPLLLPRQGSDQAVRLVASAIPAAARVADSGVELRLNLVLPDRPPGAVATQSEPVLNAQERRRWETTWQEWDAFLTHVIKQAASDTARAPLRLALMEVLLNARYDLVAALVQPTGGQTDPVRALFLRTWERLDPVLRELSVALSGEGTLRYLSFIAAVDALQALDTLGPEVGLEISADGLRRLARILAPPSSADPLIYRRVVDPELRQLFGFGAPLVLRRPHRVRSRHWIDRIIPLAGAADSLTVQQATRLDGWVPTKAEIGAYLPLVHTLLDQAALDILHSSKLQERYRSLYRKLVLATAWQESCWRQFVRKNGRVQALRSGAGSVGIMQINVRVWRGFYDPQGLEADIAYNAAAGAEILAHYLLDYAIKKGEHTKTGRLEDLARATYAVYNGGPRHLRRYRQSKTSATLQDIDTAFWSKYQTIAQGEELAVASCFGLSAPFPVPAKGATGGAEQRAAAPAEAALPGGTAAARPNATQASAGARWLLRQDPRRFTLQVVAAQDEQAVGDYIARHGLADRARYFAFRRQGQTWFAAVYGIYASRAQAEQAARSLAERINESPWVRPLSDVHDAIRGGESQG